MGQEDEAMSKVREVAADFRRQDERRKRLADALLEATEAGAKQADLVKETGFTREHVRRLVIDARKRRAARANG